MRLLGALLLLMASAVSVAAQSVSQSGSVTPSHPARWVTSGVIGDGGTPTNGSITGLGILNNGNAGLCINSAATTSASYQQFCMGPTTTADFSFSVAKKGSATAKGIQFSTNAVNSLYLASDGGMLASPTVTGGSQGPGTFNASALYVNGVASSGGSVTSVHIAAGTGIAVSGTCTITTSGTCTAALASIADQRVLGNVSGISAAPIALTPTQLTTQCNAFTSVLSGCVPASGGGTTSFLRADGTFAAPSGSGSVNSGTSGQMAYYASSTNAVSGNANANISSGALTLGVPTSVLGQLKLAGSTSGTMIITPPVAAGSGTLTLPVATDTLIGKATTDTLTNKTYDTAGSGNVLSVNGSQLTAVTGTGSVVLATTPTLVTPVLGVATATSINKMAVTAPASSSTLAVADGKTFTVSNTITLAGTDAQTYTFPAASDTVAALGTANAFTAANSYSGVTTWTGTLNVPLRVVTAAGAVTVSATTDYFICVNKTSGAATTVNLPGSPVNGRTYLIKDCKGDAATNNITVVPSSGNIDGAATYVISTNKASVAVTYDSTTPSWWVN